MNKQEIVKDMRILNPLIKKGLVIPCTQTGTKITGLYSEKSFTCCYVDDVPKRFEHNGYSYYREYLSGCFYPYVVRTKIN